MLFTLFFKECRQILKSLIFYIFILVFVMMITSQMSVMESIEPPKPGQDFYGTVKSEDKQLIMGQTLANLFRETYHNSYATYPFGFIKNVKLSEAENSEMIREIEAFTGRNWETLVTDYIDYFTESDSGDYEEVMKRQVQYAVSPKDGVTYEQFEDLMEKACRVIGKGSSYEKESYEGKAEELMDYDQAMAEYQDLCEKDRVTRAVSRLFCDYAGIVLALLPMFFGISRSLRDKRARVSEVIYAKSSSGARIILSRYLANVLMIYIPVLITAFLIQMPYQFAAERLGINPDVTAFLTGTAVWLLPEIMAVLALSFLITEFTGNIIAVFIQGAWVFMSLFGASTLQGDFGLKLIVRWNHLGAYSDFARQAQELSVNRGFYMLFAAVCIGLTILVYEKRRKEGVALFGKVWKARR